MSSVHVAVHFAPAEVKVSEYDGTHTGRPWAAVEINPTRAAAEVSVHVVDLDQVDALEAALVTVRSHLTNAARDAA